MRIPDTTGYQLEAIKADEVKLYKREAAVPILMPTVIIHISCSYVRNHTKSSLPNRRQRCCCSGSTESVLVSRETAQTWQQLSSL